MYKPRTFKVEDTQTASEYEIEHAKAGISVLTQLFETARSRVAEERESAQLTPTGALVIRLTVEQWCEAEGP